MLRAAFVGPTDNVRKVYGHGRFDAIAKRTDLLPQIVEPRDFDAKLPLLNDIEVIFSTWGFPEMTDERLDAMPSLRAVFYAAGTVQAFARPLLARGVTVVSAWRANGVSVAEFTVAQIVLGCKGYFRNVREYTSPSPSSRGESYTVC